MSAFRASVFVLRNFLAVLQAVTVRIGFQWIGLVLLDLVTIVQAVAIRVRFVRDRSCSSQDFVAVLQAVAIAVDLQRIGLVLVDLLAVLETVAVAVGHFLVGAELLLLGVGQTVAVRIGIRALAVTRVRPASSCW